MEVKLFYIIIAIFSVHHCYAQQGLTIEQLKSNIPPKTTKYKLSIQPNILKDTSVISANAVYVYEIEEEDRKNYVVISRQKSYRYIRFFDDGRVFISFGYLSFPSAEEFNDFSYGKFGYYTIKNGEVIVEIYMDKSWGVMCMIARPLPTGIEFYALAAKPDSKHKDKNRGKSFYKKEYTKLYNWPK